MNAQSIFENQLYQYEITENQVFESVFSVLPQIVYVFDLKSDTIIWINDRITEILGYHKNEVIGNPTFIPSNFPDKQELEKYEVHKKLAYKLSGGNLVTSILKFNAKNKKTHLFKIQNSILKKDQNGNVLLKLGIAEDITDTVEKFGKGILETNSKLTSKFKELNRSNKELEQFAYTASHDLQEPLRKIISFGERLEMKYKDILQEDGKMYLTRMKDAANRMKILIDDLLEYSRISNFQKDAEWININEIIDEILSDLEIKIQEKNAQIIVQQLPHINASKHLIKQLFSNLISNAIKFSDSEKSIEIKIDFQESTPNEKISNNLDSQKSYYKIMVSDNGIGFEPEFSEKIFVIFQRLHGRAKYEGTGIGLAICKKIIQQLKGEITAESKPNEGAVFSLYLPITNKII